MTKMRITRAARLPRVGVALFVAVLTGGALGCSDDEEDTEGEARETKVYLSELYGYAVSFDEESEEATSYAVVDGKCWVQPIPQEVWWAATRDDDVMDFDYFGQKHPAIAFDRVENFEEACPAGTLKTALDDDFVLDFELEYELFQRIFAEHYAFFDLREVDWDAQVQDGEARLSPEMSIDEFFSVLSESVSPLGDGHIAIEAGEGLSYSENRRADVATQLAEEALMQEDAPTEDINAYVEDYVEGQFEALGAAVEGYFVPGSAVGTLEDPIAWATIESGDARYGYLWISSFADIVEGSVNDNIAALHEAFELALDDWQEVDGVLIDVRINEGGWDLLGNALASHFVSEETHVYSKRVLFQGEYAEEVPVTVAPHEGARFTGPVAVLTSSTTISAAETFVLSMLALEQVTVVGEPTCGILSDSLPKFLPSGIYFSLSNEEYSTPNGDVFELVGVPPDIEVDVFSLIDRQAGTDASIDAAISVLAER